MKEMVLIGTHTNTLQKEITLIETILDWKKYNIPITLCSHHPVSGKIQNLVDYYIFDAKQHLDKSFTNLRHYLTDIVYLIAPFEKPCHAAAAIISYTNAIRLIHDKYDLLYMHDYDVKLNKEKLLETIRKLYPTNYEMFFFKWPNIPDSYATNIEILKSNGFQNLWGDIQSVEDYLKLAQITGTQLIEPLCKKIIEYKNLQNIVYEFDENETNQIVQNFSQHSEGDDIIPRIYLSSTNDNRAVLFLVNPTPIPIEFEIINQFMNGSKTSRKVIVSGNINIYWALFDMNQRLVIKWWDSSKEYFLFNGESYNECKFKFTNSNAIQCKWEI